MPDLMLKILKAIKNPRKTIRYLRIASNMYFKSPKNILFFIGADPNGELLFLHFGYKTCYVFEANPNRFEKLKKKFSGYENIKIYNCAVAEFDGEIEFNISSNNEGASSSVGNFSSKWQYTVTETEINMIDKIKVPCINLYNFCTKNKIQYIDDYISDIQGMDLTVLKTMKTFIDEKKIGSIKCEVTKNEYGNIYEGLSDNSESGFKELLNKNYELVSKGFGLLDDYQFEEIPEEAWEMDYKWLVRK